MPKASGDLRAVATGSAAQRYLQIEKVGTDANHADLFTKCFSAACHNVLMKMIGLRSDDDVS
eukprot:685375-Heterocapsa_arctica.AAC.1